MPQPLNERELQELERQLSRPSGTAGAELAQNMDATNRSMTVAAVEQLQLTDQQRVLEIGPGNAGHLAHVLGQAKDLAYWGLEISETMQAEAQRINADLIAEQSVTFHGSDGHAAVGGVH
ncbi:MAG: class I SAM-dependent methyltransferase, partial [Bacteroidota bacterium]